MSDQADAGPSISELLGRIVRGQHLSADDAEVAFRTIIEGRATPVQMAGVLVALRAKREDPAEVAGGVRALRAAMIPVAAENPHELVDTCGTGGGAVTTFNISTAAALLAAGAGVRVAKHGNRSFTSKCGSADVLAELGVTIELAPEAMAAVLRETGIVFMFAPLLHPAMKHVAPVRRELGVATVMNILGPLTNPAGARRQVVGVADPNLVELIAGALRELGHTHALVVHGEPGLDEISPVGETNVVEVKDGQVNHFKLHPDKLIGRLPENLDELAGGSPEHNARLVAGILRNEIGGIARAAVLLNAAAAIYVAGKAASLEEGVRAATAALQAGKGSEVLERLKQATMAARSN